MFKIMSLIDYSIEISVFHSSVINYNVCDIAQFRDFNISYILLNT